MAKSKSTEPVPQIASTVGAGGFRRGRVGTMQATPAGGMTPDTIETRLNKEWDAGWDIGYDFGHESGHECGFVDGFHAGRTMGRGEMRRELEEEKD